MDAVVTRVESKPLADLDNADAVREGFADRSALLAALRRHYPAVEESTAVDLVHFRLAD